MVATDRRLRVSDGRIVAGAPRLAADGVPVVELVETPQRAWGAERRAAGRRWLRPTGRLRGSDGRVVAAASRLTADGVPVVELVETPATCPTRATEKDQKTSGSLVDKGF